MTRVLLIAEACHAGVGRHVTDLAAGLVAGGDDVALAYSPVRIDKKFRDAVAALPGMRTVEVPMRRSPAPRDWGVVRSIRSGLGDWSPQVVHGHSTKGGIIARLMRRRGERVVYTPNAIYTLNPAAAKSARAAAWVVERGLMLRTDALIAVGRAELEHCRRVGLPKDRLRYVPNGIPPLACEPREKLREEFGFAEEDVVIGFLGRLDSQKNPEMLVRAFGRLPSWPHVKLLIVGTGPLEESVRNVAREVGVESRTVLAGYRGPGDSLPAMDVLAMPSRYEGMPYVSLEAMAVGLPLVMSRVSGQEEAVDDGENGFVVDIGDEAAMGDRIGRLVRDTELRRSMSAAALKRAERYTAEEMVRGTRSVYEDALGTSAGAAAPVPDRPTEIW